MLAKLMQTERHESEWGIEPARGDEDRLVYSTRASFRVQVSAPNNKPVFLCCERVPNK